ncbi:hypothetical protein TIFTF001_030305 [Ficus carica]|uniref:Uncharacterized protein n=1 Tax=Ficus carica TaxID=3494 RepID=A0AA88DT56_FICCA|nr:hypothetical protein TIFTF001_030305 [Ficus carica]
MKMSGGNDGFRICFSGALLEKALLMAIKTAIKMIRWQSNTAIYPSATKCAIRPGQIREEQLSSTDPSAKTRRDNQRSPDPPVSMTGTEPIRRKFSARWAVIAKFDNRLTSKVAESSRRSDHIRASEDIIKKLVEIRSPSTHSLCFFTSL